MPKPAGTTPAVSGPISLGQGRPLPPATRRYFEPRFGYDFSGVRVHADSNAARATRAVNARAFTLGRSIAFSPGQYDPDSHSGRRLLAHELTHVVQQGKGGGSGELLSNLVYGAFDQAASC